jgi:biotin operon repressor
MIDGNTFVDVWMDAYAQGKCQSDVARELGCTAANVSTRAKKLIAAGVDLPELFVKRGKTLDVSGLNEMIRNRLQ